MPSPIDAYRVFVASPGGLEAERDAFRTVITSYNERDAIERGILFIPVGWELMPGGVGRPQHLINKEVERCDYFVLVLADKWGSTPHADGQGQYTSGSEEEFSVACDNYRRGSLRQVVIFFKDVGVERLKDPGAQLSKVLEFRQRLEREKQFLFETFDRLKAFEQALERHLAKWIREHEQRSHGERPGQSAGAIAFPPAPKITTVLIDSSSATSPAVADANRLAGEGRIIEAERTLASDFNKLDVLNRFAELQVQKGSFQRAEDAFTRMQKLAKDRNEKNWEIAAANSLADTYKAQRKHREAETNYLLALDLAEHAYGKDDPKLSAILNCLADLYKDLRRFDEAEPLLIRALKLQGVALV